MCGSFHPQWPAEGGGAASTSGPILLFLPRCRMKSLEIQSYEKISTCSIMYFKIKNAKSQCKCEKDKEDKWLWFPVRRLLYYFWNVKIKFFDFFSSSLPLIPCFYPCIAGALPGGCSWSAFLVTQHFFPQRWHLSKHSARVTCIRSHGRFAGWRFHLYLIHQNIWVWIFFLTSSRGDDCTN